MAKYYAKITWGRGFKTPKKLPLLINTMMLPNWELLSYVRDLLPWPTNMNFFSIKRGSKDPETSSFLSGWVPGTVSQGTY